MFLWFGSDELNNYSIYLVDDWRLTLDHTSLMVIIPIVEEHIQTKKQMIIKYSEEERIFVKKLIEAFKDIDTSNLSDVEGLENVILSLTSSIKKYGWKT